MREFNEYLQQGTVKKQSVNKSRANFLIKESEKSYRVLLELIDKIPVTDETATLFIKSCYDLIMELIRAKMLLDGYYASGLGAHEAEVSYLKLLSYREGDVQFLDKMRFFRNGIVYYGNALDKAYAKIVIQFTKRMYLRLKDDLTKVN